MATIIKSEAFTKRNNNIINGFASFFFDDSKFIQLNFINNKNTCFEIQIEENKILKKSSFKNIKKEIIKMGKFTTSQQIEILNWSQKFLKTKNNSLFLINETDWSDKKYDTETHITKFIFEQLTPQVVSSYLLSLIKTDFCSSVTDDEKLFGKLYMDSASLLISINKQKQNKKKIKNTIFKIWNAILIRTLQETGGQKEMCAYYLTNSQVTAGGEIGNTDLMSKELSNIMLSSLIIIKNSDEFDIKINDILLSFWSFIKSYSDKDVFFLK